MHSAGVSQQCHKLDVHHRTLLCMSVVVVVVVVLVLVLVALVAVAVAAASVVFVVVFVCGGMWQLIAVNLQNDGRI